jgi:alkyldihydroxyacetonephosphate synthase
MSLEIDRASLLVRVPGAVTLGQLEAALGQEGLTLGPWITSVQDTNIADFLARGAPGAPSPFDDPADHLLAGLTATLLDGRTLDIRPGPRRAVGPDLVALVFGARERFATVDRAWLRVHAKESHPRPRGAVVVNDPPISPEEMALITSLERELRS